MKEENFEILQISLFALLVCIKFLDTAYCFQSTGINYLAYDLLNYRPNLKFSMQKQPPGNVLENLAEFTGKHLSRCLFLNEVASLYTNLWFSDIFSGIEACNFIEKKTQYTYFPVNFAKLSRTPFL